MSKSVTISQKVDRITHVANLIKDNPDHCANLVDELLDAVVSLRDTVIASGAITQDRWRAKEKL